MSLIDRLARRFGYVKPMMVRRFEGARIGRLASGWTTATTSADADIRMDLAALRARARDLAINNDYARKFLQMMVDNIVGPQGFMLQAQAADPNGQPDRLARMVIESAFSEWCRAGECDVTGRLSFADVCRQAVRAVARDGEVLLRRVRDRGFAHGYRLQLLDIDRLDIQYSTDLDNGNIVRMSVEMDRFGRPVAYWLLTQHPGATVRDPKATMARERVPASDIFHLFTPDRPEQTRGYPWMAASMTRINMLHGYEEAAIVAARTGAAKMGFFTSPDGGVDALADGQDSEGQFTSEAEPGAFQVLPQGYDFKAFDPDYPTANYADFVKSCLRGIASGLGVSYATLANDLEGVNFSSIRSGTLSERETYMVHQNWLIESLLRPIFLDWLDSALLKGVLLMPNGSALPAVKRDKFAAHAWQGRRWQWVDPLKDIEASVMAMQNGLASPYTIAAQQGVDIDDVLEDLATFQQAVKDQGVVLGKQEPAAPPVAETPIDQAVKLMAAAVATRAAEPVVHAPPAAMPVPAPSVTVQLNSDHMNTAVDRLYDTIADQGRSLAAQIREDIAAMPIVIPAPVVNIAPAEVRVEAIMPELPAPAVDVNVELPAQFAIGSLPRRVTRTEITRNNAGEIVTSRQVEEDAEQQGV